MKSITNTTWKKDTESGSEAKVREHETKVFKGRV